MYETPEFVTKPQTLLVNEGDTIRLPCFVNRLEGFVMLWKRGRDIITVGNQIVDKEVILSCDWLEAAILSSDWSGAAGGDQ